MIVIKVIKFFRGVVFCCNNCIMFVVLVIVNRGCWCMSFNFVRLVVV